MNSLADAMKQETTMTCSWRFCAIVSAIWYFNNSMRSGWNTDWKFYSLNNILSREFSRRDDRTTMQQSVC